MINNLTFVGIRHEYNYMQVVFLVLDRSQETEEEELYE